MAQTKIPQSAQSIAEFLFALPVTDFSLSTREIPKGEKGPAGMYLHVSDKAFGLQSPFSLSFTYGVRLKIAHIPDVALFNCLHSL